MKVSLLCCICVVLAVNLQFPVKGEEIAEDVGIEEIIAEEEKEGDMGEKENYLPDNVDDVLEAENLCSRYSPKEVFHTVINPHLFKILDEMSVFVDALLLHVESALHTLLPHMDQSPIGKLREEELFKEVRTFMFGSMRDMYDGVRQAWRELIITHVHTPSSPQHTLAALSHVMDAQSQGEEQLVASLQELSVTLKAIIYNSIYVIQASLSLPNNTDDHEAAMAIKRKLPNIAPNFLGKLISKLLLRGSDPGGYEKAFTNPLRSITPLVEKMYAELKTIVERKEGINEGKEEEKVGKEEPKVMEAFWKAAVEASHTHMKEWPLLDEDFQHFYSNEEYLSEVFLQLLATF